MGQIIRRWLARQPNPVQPEHGLDDISDDWVIVDRPQYEGREHHVIHEGTPVDPPQTTFQCGLQQNENESSFMPCGSHHYSLLASHNPNLPEASSNHVKTSVTRIKQKYESLMLQREAVRTSLSEFKKALRQPETTDISACFRVIKNVVGKGVQISIVQGKNPHVRIDDGVWTALPEECKLAIEHFNEVLIKSHQFLEGEQEVRQFINGQLNQLRREQHINTQADVDTCREVENLPEEIKKQAAELKCFLHDVEVAKSGFEDPKTTGFLFELPQD